MEPSLNNDLKWLTCTIVLKSICTICSTLTSRLNLGIGVMHWNQNWPELQETRNWPRIGATEIGIGFESDYRIRWNKVLPPESYKPTIKYTKVSL